MPRGSPIHSLARALLQKARQWENRESGNDVTEASTLLELLQLHGTPFRGLSGPRRREIMSEAYLLALRVKYCGSIHGSSTRASEIRAFEIRAGRSDVF